jgi:hypothetical protein
VVWEQELVQWQEQVWVSMQVLEEPVQELEQV